MLCPGSAASCMMLRQEEQATALVCSVPTHTGHHGRECSLSAHAAIPVT